MKSFVVLRVPATLDNAKPVRRESYAGPGTSIVGEFDDEDAAKADVAARSFCDYRHHYYALELRYSGDPERKSAITAPTRLPVGNQKERTRR